jgi:hypothetical protein
MNAEIFDMSIHLDAMAVNGRRRELTVWTWA